MAADEADLRSAVSGWTDVRRVMQMDDVRWRLVRREVKATGDG